MQRGNSLQKTLMLRKIEEEKGTTEDEMVGWHHQLKGHEFSILNVDVLVNFFTLFFHYHQKAL